MMLLGCDSEFFKQFSCAPSIFVLIQACAVLPKVLTTQVERIKNILQESEKQYVISI